MNKERLMTILQQPHVSEKSTLLAEGQNQIVFQVHKSADKREIKRAVELMFEVEVENVTTLNVKGKTKRTGMHMGKRKDWKKAYVTLKDGHDIDFLGSE